MNHLLTSISNKLFWNTSYGLRLKFGVLLATLLFPLFLMAQSFAFEVNNMQLAFHHVKNEFIVVVENHGCGDFIVTCEHGELLQDSCHLTYQCDHTVYRERFKVYVKEGDSLRFIGSEDIRFRKQATPLASLCSKRYGSIGIGSLSWMPHLQIDDHFGFETIESSVHDFQSYDLRIIRNDTVIHEVLASNLKWFSNSTRNFISQKCKIGDVIEISNITMLLYGVEPRESEQVISLTLRE